MSDSDFDPDLDDGAIRGFGANPGAVTRDWGASTPAGPPTEQEKVMFPDRSPVRVPIDLGPAPGASPAQQAVADAARMSLATAEVNARVTEALVKKFPDFNPEWPPKAQAAWFEAYAKLMEKGAGK